MNLKEKLLILRFNRGDVDAVHMIYDLFKGDLMALALSLLRDTGAAEDVVHDVFVSFLKLPRFRLTGSLKGYLATCVANASRNLLRANHRHAQEPIERIDALAAGGSGPDALVIEHEENLLLNRAVQELPDEQREVVMLHLRGGLKFAEIAKCQQVSLNTVQGRYRYGLEKVRMELSRFTTENEEAPRPAGDRREGFAPPSPATAAEECE